MNSNTIQTDGHSLPIVEEFYTVQGEGHNTGRAAYFIRLAGCDVKCPWCDSKHSWNASCFACHNVKDIAARTKSAHAPHAVITGGEPTMHHLGPLTSALHDLGIATWLETSGTHQLSGHFDWICLSPKRHMPPTDEACRNADELKVIISTHDDFAWAEECAARTTDTCLLYLQPEWDSTHDIMPDIVEYVKLHPQWRISLQTHKFMNIP